METNFTGNISAQLNVRKIEEICIESVRGYDPKRFKVIAIHVSDSEVTVSAADSFHQPLFGEPNPVKKFKITCLSPASILELMSNFNFTLLDEQILSKKNLS